MAWYSVLLKPLVDGLTSWNKGRVKIKEAKIQVQLAKYKAQEARWQSALKAETDWDMEALKQSRFTWKDEYLLFILTLPFIGSFIPEIQDDVVKGWDYVAKAPVWYQTAFIGVIAATFGLRWLFQKRIPDFKKGIE